MKISKRLTSVLALSALLLFPVVLQSCGGSSSGGSSAVVASVPSSLTGSTIVFNPEIRFISASRFEYDNTLSNISALPPGRQEGDYDLVSGPGDDEITVTLNIDDHDTPIILTLSGFLDNEDDGDTDSFDYHVSYDGEDQSGGGIFVSGNPANENSDSTEDAGTAPTVDEFNQYAVGRHLELDGDDGYRHFLITGTNSYEHHSDGQVGTYTYAKTGDDTGEFTTMESGPWEEDGETGTYTEDQTITVTFDSFFSGSYSSNSSESGFTDGDGPYGPEIDFDQGDFQILSEVDF